MDTGRKMRRDQRQDEILRLNHSGHRAIVPNREAHKLFELVRLVRQLLHSAGQLVYRIIREHGERSSSIVHRKARKIKQ